jgi:diacylglycerol kinase (ATP)
MRAIVIVNPAAGRGRAGALVPALRDAFGAHGITDIRLTSHRGDEGRVVREALAAGAESVAIVGGDGTWGQCAAAVLEAGAADRVRLAFITAGTGNDFAKGLGAPSRDLVAMAALVADQSVERRVDAGRVESGGRTHWFINSIGFGFDALVLEDAQRKTMLRGQAVYIAAALRRLLTYEGFAYTLGGPDGVTTLGMMLTVSNTPFLGGAFRIAPAARVDDGYLDLVEIGNVLWVFRPMLFLRAVRGTHVHHGGVRARRGLHFVLAFAGAPKCDLDGELVQLASRDVVVRVVPKALRVVSR